MKVVVLVGYGKRCRMVMVRPVATDLDRLTAWVDAGELRPAIDRVYPLAEIRAAHTYGEAGHTRGKVVIQVGSDG